MKNTNSNIKSINTYQALSCGCLIITENVKLNRFWVFYKHKNITNCPVHPNSNEGQVAIPALKDRTRYKRCFFS